MKLFVTGGAGFIGSAFVRMALVDGRAGRVAVFDKLTYAGNLENLEPVAAHTGYRFIQGDICDVAAFFNYTNRMAFGLDMMPNAAYHAMHR